MPQGYIKSLINNVYCRYMIVLEMNAKDKFHSLSDHIKPILYPDDNERPYQVPDRTQHGEKHDYSRPPEWFMTQ